LNREIEFIIKSLSKKIINNDAREAKISLKFGDKFFLSSKKPIKKKIIKKKYKNRKSLRLLKKGYTKKSFMKTNIGKKIIKLTKIIIPPISGVGCL
tara:strand:- start:44 stop:331 length:288 start_codon:yes stop_codon:yes gene_type:complete